MPSITTNTNTSITTITSNDYPIDHVSHITIKEGQRFTLTITLNPPLDTIDVDDVDELFDWSSWTFNDEDINADDSTYTIGIVDIKKLSPLEVEIQPAVNCYGRQEIVVSFMGKLANSNSYVRYDRRLIVDVIDRIEVGESDSERELIVDMRVSDVESFELEKL